jgi:hypothetical protein
MIGPDNGIPGLTENELQTAFTRKEYHQEEQSQCSICMEQFTEGEQLVSLRCKHLYHESCVRQWLQRRGNCPNCRTLAIEPISLLDSETRV